MDVEGNNQLFEVTEGTNGNANPMLNPSKKLKQVRLPFKTLDPKSAQITPETGNTKKRRLSDKDSLHRSNKSLRTESEQENKNLSDNVYRLSRKTHNRITSIPKITDDEISSSCEFKTSVVDDVDTSVKKVEKCTNLLEKFVKKEHPQVPEISTSSDLIVAEDESNSKENLSKDEEGSSAVIEKATESVDTSLNNDDCKESLDDADYSKDLINTSGIDGKESELDITATSIDLDSSIDDMNTSVETTPKSSGKMKTKKQEERERIRQEKLKNLQDAKEEKKKQKELLKEQRDKEKAQIKAKKDLEKQKQLEAKMEEKRKKDLERQKKEEDKKKKDEEKRSRDEEKRLLEEEENKKKEKVKMAFASFFVKKKTSSEKNHSIDLEAGFFKPFQITKGMYVSPLSRSEIIDKDCFDVLLNSQDNGAQNYLEALKTGCYTSKKDSKTCTSLVIEDENIDDDIEIMDVCEDSNDYVDSHKDVEMPNPKLIQFHENRRPPFWGTFRKKSKKIGPRRPFSTDSDLFDYEVDSDDEWEEEEPGESLHGSDDDKESEDDYDEDGEFMVPHGYLSADEEDEDPEQADSPETQKQKLKLRAEEFQQDMKKSSQRHVKRPRIVGCLWMNSQNFSKELGENEKLKFFLPYQYVCLDSFPIATSFTKVKVEVQKDKSPSSLYSKESCDETTPKFKNFRPVPEDAMPYLVQLLHANMNSRSTIISEFKEFWKQRSLQATETPTGEKNHSPPTKSLNLISKRQLEMTIQKISTWTKFTHSETFNRMCWVVNGDVLEKYNLKSLPAPNAWNYVSKNLNLRPMVSDVSSPSVEPVKINKITKFVKAMSPQNFGDLSKIGGNKTPCQPVQIIDSMMRKSTTTIKALSSSSSDPVRVNRITKFVKTMSPQSSLESSTLDKSQGQSDEVQVVDLIINKPATTNKVSGPMMKFMKANNPATSQENISKEDVKVINFSGSNELQKLVASKSEFLANK